MYLLSYDLLTRDATSFHAFSFALESLYPLLDTSHKQGKQRTASISFSSSISGTGKKRLAVYSVLVGVPIYAACEVTRRDAVL